MYDLIKKWEGFESKAYLCPAGIWTIGYGSTKYEDGTPVKKGDVITQARAEKLLSLYIEQEILPRLRSELKGLKPYEEEALVSLIYNWGSGFFRSNLLKAIKQNDMYNIVRNWDVWNVNGKPMNGLIKRRIDELHLFLGV